MELFKELQKAYGNHFQDLFSRIMKERYGVQFQAISSYGNNGDMKVDGVLNYETAFAVYAPEIYSDEKTIRKMKADFRGFLEHKKNGFWNEIKTYVFVIKRERNGVTASVLNLISEFRIIFPVEVWTMEDLAMIVNGFLPFSSDGRLLNEFKSDVTQVMEYIIDTDFAAEPFYMSLTDEIQLKILAKWSKKQFSFKEEKLEKLKMRILSEFGNLCMYLTPEYVHVLHNGLLMFNNDSKEAGERLKNEMQPRTYEIRCEVSKLLEELYSIK